MTAPPITCPSCGTSFELTEALAKPLEARLATEHAAELVRLRDRLNAEADARVIEAQRSTREDSLLENQLLQRELADERERRAAAQAAEIALRQERNVLESRGRDLDLEVARRLDAAAAYVPRHDERSISDLSLARVREEAGEEKEPRIGDVLTFAELAAKSIDGGKGRPMLAALKADVDRLGQLFTRGLGERRSLARAAALSRMMDAFFTGHLSHRLERDFPRVYTVYAGGDDLLLLGPWYDIFVLARELREDFRRFVGGSLHVTLSAGLALFDPKTPISRAAREAEERLAKAKEDGRDRVHAVLSIDSPALIWDQYSFALRDADRIHELINAGSQGATLALLYKLLWLDGRRRACEEKGETRAADWRAKLGYHLWRALPQGNAGDEESRTFLCRLMGVDAQLEQVNAPSDRASARVALSIAIYRNR
jgi:CRISPR-associated protein Csm1